ENFVDCAAQVIAGRHVKQRGEDAGIRGLEGIFFPSAASYDEADRSKGVLDALEAALAIRHPFRMDDVSLTLNDRATHLTSNSAQSPLASTHLTSSPERRRCSISEDMFAR